MEDKIKIFHLGGQDERDNNLTVVEINDDIFVINCGMKYPDKTKHGIDFTIPRFDYLIENKQKIKGYFLCSGSAYELGGLPYLIRRAPAKVYCTKMTSTLFKVFCSGVKAKVDLDFCIVDPCDEVTINGRNIKVFHTATNIPHSFGISISTDKGNIVYIDDFVIDNNCDVGYETNTKMLAEVARENTLIFLCGSRYSTIPGYANPRYKLVPLIEKTFRDTNGRIFAAIESLDIYNLEMVSKLAVRYGRIIIPYDEQTHNFYTITSSVYSQKIPPNLIGTFDDALRLPPEKVMVLITGHGPKLFHKISLLGEGQPHDLRMRLLPGDTFIWGIQANNKNDVLTAETLDELYRAKDMSIIYFNKKTFFAMHPCEEDIKTMLSILRPKYYAPIAGDFKSLLANAQIAVNMKIGINHLNCFILDNGMILEIDSTGAHISKNKVITGEILVDGMNTAINDLTILSDRKVLAQDGVVAISAAISLTNRKVTFGPDVQTRGLVMLKEGDTLNTEIIKIFNLIVAQEFAKPVPSKQEFETNLIEEVLKEIRRRSLKSPLIVPSIIYE